MSTIYARNRRSSQLLKYIIPHRIHRELLSLDCGKKRKYFPLKYIEYRYAMNKYMMIIIENVNIVKEIRLREESISDKLFDALENAIINTSLLIDTITDYIFIRNLPKLSTESKTKAKVLRKFDNITKTLVEYRADLMKYSKNLKAKRKRLKQ